MTIAARFTFDEAHLLESLNRNRRQTRGRHIFTGVKIVAGLLFVAMGSILLISDKIGLSLILFAPAIVLAFAHKLDQPSICRRFRKSPFYGINVRYTFTEERIEVVHEKSEIKMDWSVFTRLVVFKDGLLAFQGDGVSHWIPESSFDSRASFEAAEELFRSKIRNTK